MHPTLQSFIGLLAFLAIAYAVSEQRNAVRPSVGILGIALQFAIAVVCLKVPIISDALGVVAALVNTLQDATLAGTSLIFGYLGGGPLPFVETRPGGSFILAFQALPLVILLSALTALLTYWRVLPLVVAVFAKLLRRLFRLSGAVGFSSAANVFVGMIEAPLFVRPYLERLSRSELFVVMTVGMATVAGTVLVLYAGLLSESVPGAARHLVVASVISVPAAVVVALWMVPPSLAQDDALDASEIDVPRGADSAMDAITKGTQTGLSLFLNIVALLLVLVAFVYLIDAMLGVLPDVGGAALSLQRIFGWVMGPVAWLLGIPWGAESQVAGGLLATKTVLNEFLAFLDFAALAPEALSERSRVILAYALCGFANPGSVGILIGGLCTLMPERRAEILALGPRALLSGTLATCMTGATIGVLHS
ncbi:MAG: nucleoside:proton symporter [Gammaproteobacteria bacterium]|nr:nucleoside:proton symporter [Gammaproteobacteria bacterium]